MSSVHFDRILARNVRGRNTAELEEYTHEFYAFFFFVDSRNCIHAHLNSNYFLRYFKYALRKITAIFGKHDLWFSLMFMLILHVDALTELM